MQQQQQHRQLQGNQHYKDKISGKCLEYKPFIYSFRHDRENFSIFAYFLPISQELLKFSLQIGGLTLTQKKPHKTFTIL
jgi:hypothetical protein